MLKVKKRIYTSQNRQKNQISRIKDDLKNSIKIRIWIIRKKDKTINGNSPLIDRIRR